MIQRLVWIGRSAVRQLVFFFPVVMIPLALTESARHVWLDTCMLAIVIALPMVGAAIGIRRPAWRIFVGLSFLFIFLSLLHGWDAQSMIPLLLGIVATFRGGRLARDGDLPLALSEAIFSVAIQIAASIASVRIAQLASWRGISLVDTALTVLWILFGLNLGGLWDVTGGHSQSAIQRSLLTRNRVYTALLATVAFALWAIRPLEQWIQSAVRSIGHWLFALAMLLSLHGKATTPAARKPSEPGSIPPLVHSHPGKMPSWVPLLEDAIVLLFSLVVLCFLGLLLYRLARRIVSWLQSSEEENFHTVGYTDTVEAITRERRTPISRRRPKEGRESFATWDALTSERDRVRLAYRVLLQAITRQGTTVRADDTVHRVAAKLDDAEVNSIELLADIYDAARYGAADVPPDSATTAKRIVQSVLAHPHPQGRKKP